MYTILSLILQIETNVTCYRQNTAVVVGNVVYKFRFKQSTIEEQHNYLATGKAQNAENRELFIHY